AARYDYRAQPFNRRCRDQRDGKFARLRPFVSHRVVSQDVVAEAWMIVFQLEYAMRVRAVIASEDQDARRAVVNRGRSHDRARDVRDAPPAFVISAGRVTPPVGQVTPQDLAIGASQKLRAADDKERAALRRDNGQDASRARNWSQRPPLRFARAEV